MSEGGRSCRKVVRGGKLGREPREPEPAVRERDETLELGPGATVVIGEMHGTHEVPAFVAAMADELDGPVTVGLELPGELQPGVDAMIGGAGRGALLGIESPFWGYRDGRGGDALLGLLERLLARGDARIVCFDGTWPSAEARDRGMAATLIAAIEGEPHAIHLVICGNLHARTDDPRWMGWHLRRRFPGLLALDAQFDGGDAFATTERGSGLVSLGVPRGDPRRGIELFGARDERGYDGEIHVGTATPSLPLVPRAR